MSFIDNYGGQFLVTNTIAMPNNLNQDGDVFGGWILSLMDMASVLAVGKICEHRVVTRAVSDVCFNTPIALGDNISVYAEIEHVGNSSIRIKIDVYAKGKHSDKKHAVSGKFTMVAIDAERRPININEQLAPVNSNIYKA